MNCMGPDCSTPNCDWWDAVIYQVKYVYRTIMGVG